MSFDPVTPDRSVFRPGMVVAPLAAIAVGGLAFVLLSPGGGIGPRDGGMMQVEVVAPVETEVEPGGTMEVGELVDGYTHVAIAAPVSEADRYDPEHQTAWIEPEPSEPRPSIRVWTSAPPSPPTPVPPEGRAGSYGFDAPGPDYAAERRARQERLDRIQAELASRGMAGQPGITPSMDRDSAFY